MISPVNLAEKLTLFDDHWAPRTVAMANGQDLMVVKVLGAFERHTHADTDDVFLVLKGELDIELEDRHVTVRSGELFVVPQGVAHQPIAKEEVHLLLIERSGTPNSGDSATAAPRRFL